MSDDVVFAHRGGDVDQFRVTVDPKTTETWFEASVEAVTAWDPEDGPSSTAPGRTPRPPRSVRSWRGSPT